MRDSKGRYINEHSKSDLFIRALWNIWRVLFFKPFPTKIFRKWRLFQLRLWGAKIHYGADVYSSVKILKPWLLTMDNLSCLGPYVILENDVMVTLEENATISQYCYLCTSSHIIHDIGFDLISKPIIVKKNAWVAADSFIGMGVTIGEGAVVGARSSVFKNVEPYTVVGGNPIKLIKNREINH